VQEREQISDNLARNIEFPKEYHTFYGNFTAKNNITDVYQSGYQKDAVT
jgi:hypothetical protein